MGFLLSGSLQDKFVLMFLENLELRLFRQRWLGWNYLSVLVIHY